MYFIKKYKNYYYKEKSLKYQYCIIYRNYPRTIQKFFYNSVSFIAKRSNSVNGKPDDPRSMERVN